MRKTKKEKPLLAQNIIRRRKELGWTNALDFAEHAKVKYPTLRDIEAGISGGSDTILDLIAQALGCTIDDLRQKPILTKWESMTQRQMAEAMLSQAKEIDELKAEINRLNQSMKELNHKAFMFDQLSKLSALKIKGLSLHDALDRVSRNSG